MEIKDLILELQKLNPEDKIEFVGSVEHGFGETIMFFTDEVHIQCIDGGLVQLIIQGEED
jgi:hypothetical protein